MNRVHRLPSLISSCSRTSNFDLGDVPEGAAHGARGACMEWFSDTKAHRIRPMAVLGAGPHHGERRPVDAAGRRAQLRHGASGDDEKVGGEHGAPCIGMEGIEAAPVAAVKAQ